MKYLIGFLWGVWTTLTMVGAWNHFNSAWPLLIVGLTLVSSITFIHTDFES